MPFSPNTGYAFAVGDDTWHSADPVGPEVKTRDSILHTYFVDSGLLRVLRNRSRRVGNFIGELKCATLGALDSDSSRPRPCPRRCRGPADRR